MPRIPEQCEQYSFEWPDRFGTRAPPIFILLLKKNRMTENQHLRSQSKSLGFTFKLYINMLLRNLPLIENEENYFDNGKLQQLKNDGNESRSIDFPSSN